MLNFVIVDICRQSVSSQQQPSRDRENGERRVHSRRDQNMTSLQPASVSPLPSPSPSPRCPVTMKGLAAGGIIGRRCEANQLLIKAYRYKLVTSLEFSDLLPNSPTVAGLPPGPRPRKEPLLTLHHYHTFIAQAAFFPRAPCEACAGLRSLPLIDEPPPPPPPPPPRSGQWPDNSRGVAAQTGNYQLGLNWPQTVS